MQPISEPDIRAAFVNCSKGEAQRAHLPRDLAERRWDDLDFLGWRDQGSPERSYLAAEHGGHLVAVALRVAQQQRRTLASGMCSFCLTVHSGNGVSLMTARRTGKAGRNGDSVGVYLCSDLGCSLYVRGLRKPGFGSRLSETLTVGEQVDRLNGKLTAFLGRIIDGAEETG